MSSKTRPKKTTSRKAPHHPEHDTTEFEREFVANSFKRPSPKAREKWRKARRKRGKE